jgi:hypothetical protein
VTLTRPTDDPSHLRSSGQRARGTGAGPPDSQESVRLLDLMSGKIVRQLDGLIGGVASLVFSPDSRRLYVGGNSKITTWDQSGGYLGSLPDGNHSNGIGLSISADGRYLIATGGASGCGGSCVEGPDLLLYDVESGHLLKRLRHSSSDTELYQPTISPNGQFVAACDQNNRIVFWKVTQVKPLRAPSSAADCSDSVRFSQDSKALTMVNKGRVFIIDVSSGKILDTDKISDNSQVPFLLIVDTFSRRRPASLIYRRDPRFGREQNLGPISRRI